MLFLLFVGTQVAPSVTSHFAADSKKERDEGLKFLTRLTTPGLSATSLLPSPAVRTAQTGDTPENFWQSTFGSVPEAEWSQFADAYYSYAQAGKAAREATQSAFYCIANVFSQCCLPHQPTHTVLHHRAVTHL